MRILQIVNIGHEAGGAEKSVRLITDGLRARGHDVRVIATDLLAAGQDTFADHLVPAIRGSAPRRFLHKLWHPEAFHRVREVVADFRPECVHLHTIGEFSPSVLAATAGVPRLLTVHGPEDWTLELLRWNLPTATGRGGLSAADRARYAYLRLVQRPAYRARLRQVDRVLTPSRYFADAVVPDVGVARTHVLPNGIRRTATPTPIADPGRLLFVGRLEHVKGAGVLLRAFRDLAAEHPAAHLTLVGDGTERRRLESEHADLCAAGRVAFTGWLPAEEVGAAVARSAVVVLPSLWPENFPTVALEALQAGRPIVASRVGGLPELVGDDNGVLVPPGDPAALGDALRDLLGKPGVLDRLGDGSAARAHRYDADRFLDALEHHYEEVVAGRGRRTTVAVVTPYYPPKIGGVENYAARVAQATAAAPGTRAVVLTTKPGPRTTVGADGDVPVIRLGSWLRLSNTPLSPLWPLQVRRWLRRLDVDVLNLHAPVPGLADMAMLAAGKRPAVLTYHAGTMRKGAAAADRLIVPYERLVLPRLFRRADVLVAVSPASLAAGRPGAVAITPGVDTAVFTPGLPPSRRSPEILYVGRIDRASAWKGLDVLLRAFALLADRPEARLRVVGGGDALGDHRHLAAELGVGDRVDFAGELRGPALVSAMRDAALLVLPSLTAAESFGMVLVEAMACGTPVVGSAVGGIPHVVTHEVTGLLTPPGEPGALAVACHRLLTDATLADRLGRAGRAHAQEHYSWPRLTDRYVALFEGLGSGGAGLSRGPRRSRPAAGPRRPAG